MRRWLPAPLLSAALFALWLLLSQSLAAGDLLLAAEVLSPGSETYDRGDKRAIYQAEGTPLYWLLDHVAGVVEEWTPAATAPRVERERLVWHPDGARVPFELELAYLFRPI